jgi:hypothetical protein
MSIITYCVHFLSIVTPHTLALGSSVHNCSGSQHQILGFGEEGGVQHVLFATITMHNDLKTFGLSLHTHMGVNQSGMQGCILSAGFGVWACHIMSTSC